jgi:hypothetical protein
MGHWLDGSRPSKPMKKTWVAVFRYLLAKESGEATAAEILTYLKANTTYRGGCAMNVKKIGQAIRRAYALQPHEAVRGRRGEDGGGLALVREDAPDP